MKKPKECAILTLYSPIGRISCAEKAGGIYEKQTFESNLAVYRAKKRKQERQREEQKQKDKRELNNALINAYRWGVEHNAPLSDAWCENYNALQKQLYVHETINETR